MSRILSASILLLVCLSATTSTVTGQSQLGTGAIKRFTLELLAEGFNVFNRANFNGFNTTLYSADFPLIPGTSQRYTNTNPPRLPRRFH